jgi:hypothetical protein
MALVILTALAINQGCQLFPHWMQPSQLWKLNRQPAYDESTFSVPDPLDPPVVGAAPDADPRPNKPF